MGLRHEDTGPVPRSRERLNPMRIIRGWLHRLLGMFRHEASDADFRAEMESHVEMHVEDSIRAGLAPVEARRQALLRLGGVEPLREVYRDRSGVPFLENFARDLRHAVRTLRRSPAFTIAAIASVALGIGANTAVFSLVNAVLLRPLPYPSPERLIHVGRGGEMNDLSNAEYEIIKLRVEAFESVAGHRGLTDVRIEAGAANEWVPAASVTPDYFRTLGLGMALGRKFSGDEGRRGGPQAAILTHATWRRLFNEDPGVIGRAIRVDGVPHSIAGVAREDSWLPDSPALFVPLRMQGGVADLGANTVVIARLRDGVSPARATASLEAAGEEFRRQHPDHAHPRGSVLVAQPYQDSLTAGSGKKLLLLMGATGMLLLIACLNLASLVVARLTARRREVAVRLALGSNRVRLMQHSLAESIVICAAGGFVGLLAARALLDTLVAAIPFHLPSADPIAVDSSVLGFTAAAAMATVILTGLIPAIFHSRMGVSEALKSAGRVTRASGRQRLRGVLVVAQVAGASALLIGAALLAHSLFRLHRQPLGFDPEGLLTFWTSPVKGQESAKRLAAQQEILARLRATPGVRDVAAVNMLPLAGQNNFPAQRENHPEHSIGGMEIRIVSPDYFRAMRIPLLRGRGFNERDTNGTIPAVIISESVARTWWPGGDPLGDRVAMGVFRGKRFGEDPVREVVGVVADTKAARLAESSRPVIYLPAAQASWYGGGMFFVMRGGTAESARAALAQTGPSQRVERMRTMESIVSGGTSATRFDAVLFAIFGFMALSLTVTGVYGLLSFSVACRTSEIGTRLALGATRRQVSRMVLGQGMRFVVAGLALGLALALALSRSLTSSLFEISTADPASFGAVTLLLLIAGLAASYFPARTATRVDPLTALRCD